MPLYYHVNPSPLPSHVVPHINNQSISLSPSNCAPCIHLNHHLGLSPHQHKQPLHHTHQHITSTNYAPHSHYTMSTHFYFHCSPLAQQLCPCINTSTPHLYRHLSSLTQRPINHTSHSHTNTSILIHCCTLPHQPRPRAITHLDTSLLPPNTSTTPHLYQHLSSLT